MKKIEEMEQKKELKNEETRLEGKKQEEILPVKQPRDYFKVVEVAVDATKNANPSIMDKLGIYRGPVFVAMASYFVLNMIGWSFVANVLSMGLIVCCIVHFLIHMGTVKETLNTSIDSVVETTKDKLKKKKKEVDAKEEKKEEKKPE